MCDHDTGPWVLLPTSVPRGLHTERKECWLFPPHQQQRPALIRGSSALTTGEGVDWLLPPCAPGRSAHSGGGSACLRQSAMQKRTDFIGREDAAQGPTGMRGNSSFRGPWCRGLQWSSHSAQKLQILLWEENMSWKFPGSRILVSYSPRGDW